MSVKNNNLLNYNEREKNPRLKVNIIKNKYISHCVRNIKTVKRIPKSEKTSFVKPKRQICTFYGRPRMAIHTIIHFYFSTLNYYHYRYLSITRIKK